MDIELLSVSKPARYIGGEINSIIKDDKDLLKFCLIFPDIYEIGMSHVGYKLLYSIINQSDKISCERFFAPYTDALERFGKKIFISLEHKRQLIDFDILGFSVSYELSYTTILRILKEAGIKPYSNDRLDDDTPIIMMGGGATFNPMPIADFIDIFYIGEGDENINPLLEHIDRLKRSGMNKLAIFEELNTAYPFLYIPIIDDKKIVHRDISLHFAKSVTNHKTIIPIIEAVQDRVAVEIARGCTAGCRFCQAGSIYRPVRERDVDKVIEDTLYQLDCTGYREVSLLSLSTGDYSEIGNLTKSLNDILKDEMVSLTTPSLRANSVSKELMKELLSVRKSGFTIAPEAGSERLRRVINKNLSEEDILNAVKLASEAGIRAVKLYFMIGLPYETDEDVIAIIELAKKIEQAVSVRGFNINISVSHFVPKPETIFERFGQADKEEFFRKIGLLRDAVKKTRYRLKYHDIKVSKIEAVLSRGSRDIGKVLYKLMEEGAYLEAWSEFFSYDRWVECADKLDVVLTDHSDRFYNADEVLPWGHISSEISKQFKEQELKRAKSEVMIDDCRFGNCYNCGVCNDDTIKVYQSDKFSFLPKNKVEKDTITHKRYLAIYEKLEESIYLSALDLNRIIIQSLLISKIPLRYSEGFNPSPRLSLALPLPVGMGGFNEILIFDSAPINGEIIDTINHNLPKGIHIKSIVEAEKLKVGMDFVSEYRLSDRLSAIINTKLSVGDNIEYHRKAKSGGDKTINLSAYLHSYGGNLIRIKADSSGSFNLIAFFTKEGINLKDNDIVRTEIRFGSQW